MGPSFSAQRLKNAYRGERAAVIMGGASLIAQPIDLGRLASKGFVTFLESKALTPHLVASGFSPDFFLMLSPEKCMSNAFHNWVFRAFLAGFRLDRYVRPEFLPVLQGMRDRFDEYFEPGTVSRGAHKTYRWKNDVHLADAPIELLAQVPRTKLLAERSLLQRYCPSLAGVNEQYLYDQRVEPEPFSLDRYYNVTDEDDRAMVPNCAFQNSAMMALFPLLHYMGFRSAYFVGLDMSMLGSMEYSAPYTFKSMLHFRWYFRRTRHVFNAVYRPNRPWFLRPRTEFEGLQALIDPSRIDLVRVFSPYRYTVATPFMNAVTPEALWQL